MAAYGGQGVCTSSSTHLADECLLIAQIVPQRACKPFRAGCLRKQTSRSLLVRSRPSSRGEESQAAIVQTLQNLEESLSTHATSRDNAASGPPVVPAAAPTASQRRKAAKARHQLTYKVAAISASLGITALAVAAVHYRYAWQIQNGGEIPVTEAVCTILLVFGGVVGMEMWARWAHKALWHDFAPGWSLHKSHHAPRLGPFEANDVFAIVNAAPAIGLCAYGFLTPTVAGGLSFGLGLGITLFGMMYMFVHDGLVHKRFPVGPLADVPYLKRVAAAHKLHHAEKFEGVPWGLFLGPQELEAVGGAKELEYMCRQMDAAKERDAARL